MKYCTKCGNQIMDEAVICPQCGCSTGYQNVGNGYKQPVKISTLKKVAKAFMIVGTVVQGLYIIPLAWCLPMTISYCKKINRGEPIGTGFKICNLLFVNLIAGILMLCENEQ